MSLWSHIITTVLFIILNNSILSAAPIILPGDINNDGNRNLSDAILALKIVSNITLPVAIYREADVNEDEKIGLAEAIYALQLVAGLGNKQEALEGIWYTEDRYLFVDNTGKLSNIEPISTEIIHDFSGSFTVNDSYVTGTIYLDHTPSDGIRNDHDIIYSGLFVGSDEIEMSWAVPGAGNGLQTWKRIAYTGNTEQAHIDAENALILANGVEQSINPVKNLKIYYLTGTSTTVDEVLVGDCGGNAEINGIINAETGEFTGTLQYNNFCDEDTGGFTLDGPAAFFGYTNLMSHQPLRYQYYFDAVAFDEADKSFSIKGRKGFNFTISPRSMILSYVFTDKSIGINYWLKDYINRQTNVANYGDILTAIGKFYDPNYGYVEISVGETIRIYLGDRWPSSGKLLLTGTMGSSGSNTKIRITYLSNAEYLVEADTDGDGAYDFNSGILLWSEL